MADLVKRLDVRPIVVTFKLPRLFGFRMWFTVNLIKLAGLIAPITINVEMSKD